MISTKIYTWLKGVNVGTDEFGNKYYTHKKLGDAKRWVIYNGIVEGSKVPPLWNAWLHYNLDEVPNNKDIKTYKWQKEHQPNLTGTSGAYVPSGHARSKVKERTKSGSDYEAWTP